LAIRKKMRTFGSVYFDSLQKKIEVTIVAKEDLTINN